MLLTEAVNRSTGHSSIPRSQKAPPTAPNVLDQLPVDARGLPGLGVLRDQVGGEPNQAAVRVASRIPV